MRRLAALGVTLTADSAPYKAGLDDATKSTRAFEANVKKSMKAAETASKELQATITKVGTAVVAVGAAALKALSWADQISDTADAFDITISSLRKLQQALDVSGNKGENITKMFVALAKNATDAAEGVDDARDKFAKLGITGKEVETLALDQLFARVAEELAHVENATKRSAYAYDVLSKAAKGTDWKEFIKIYGSGKEVSDGVSDSIAEGAKAWDNLGKSGKAALEGILVLLKPLTSFINWMAEKIAEAKKKPNTGSLFDAEFGGAFGLDETAFLDLPKAPAPTPLPKKSGTYTDPLSKKQLAEQAAAESVRQQTIEYARQVGLAIQRQQIETDLAKLTDKQREIVIATNKVEEERAKLLQDAQKDLEVELAKGKEGNQQKIKALQDQILAINQMKNAEKSAIKEIIEARQAEQNSFVFGWERAFNQYIEDSENAAKKGQEAFNLVVGSMEKALDEFVKTGKLHFKDFVQSVIQGLIRIQLQAQATSLFKSAFGSLGDFLFGSQNSAPIVDSSVYSSGAQVFPVMGDGGSVSANSPYIVGDLGPELFVPQTSGTIIPNNQLSSSLGATTQVVYNGPYIQNMSAIDTQSATQFLAANKQAVYAANISAGRSLPVSR